MGEISPSVLMFCNHKTIAKKEFFPVKKIRSKAICLVVIDFITVSV
jgi:hypothetical protein